MVNKEHFNRRVLRNRLETDKKGMCCLHSNKIVPGFHESAYKDFRLLILHEYFKRFSRLVTFYFLINSLTKFRNKDKDIFAIIQLYLELFLPQQIIQKGIIYFKSSFVVFLHLFIILVEVDSQHLIEPNERIFI